MVFRHVEYFYIILLFADLKTLDFLFNIRNQNQFHTNLPLPFFSNPLSKILPLKIPTLKKNENPKRPFQSAQDSPNTYISLFQF